MRWHLKSSLAARRLTPLLAWVCLLGAVAALAACGQKGPLTLPPAASAASAPAQ
jgi:predicted small lipoprotein YifL